MKEGVIPKVKDERRKAMKSGILVVSEYSKGRNFEEAVANLFKNGLMNGKYSTVRIIDRKQAQMFFRSWFCEIHQEGEVKYIVTVKYDEDSDEWRVDYSAGVEVLPCQ